MNLDIGTVIDERYKITGPVGQGGMATVYLVNHVTLGSDHALKVLHLTTPSIRDRLIQEGRIQSAIQHPNIVTVTDVVTINDAPGLVMEMINGPSLRQLLDKEKLTLEQVDDVAKGLITGVGAAHDAGLIHRDLKPANVLMAITSEGLTPKITDFGLAKHLDKERADSATRTGIAMGTPAFIAPEQIVDAKSADHRADLFSLGVILYEMVTGVRPFQGNSAVEIMGKIQSGLYTPPEALNPDLPSRMNRAIMSALQADKEKRVQNSKTLMDHWLGRSGETQIESGPWQTNIVEAARSIVSQKNSQTIITPAPENRLDSTLDPEQMKPAPQSTHPLSMPVLGDVVSERYILESKLGEGGFATVFLARDKKIDGTLAIKILDPHKSGDPEFASRFHQEIKLTRKLRHPNTISIWDAGTTETGCLFMAMEYVTGEHLGDIIAKDGAFSVERVARVAAQIAKSLAEAHKIGIVHRDLKPGNIMLCQLEGESDYVKVLDFGIAKALSSELDSFKTQTGMLLCTPSYASPELLRGLGVQPTSDIYSLGLIMLEMATGNTAIQGRSLGDVIAKQCDSQPIPIPEEIIDSSIGHIIQTAISKEVETRYQTALDLLSDLKTAEKDATISGAISSDKTQTLIKKKTKERPAVSPPTQIGDFKPDKQRSSLSRVLIVSLFLCALLAGVLMYFITDKPEQIENNSLAEISTVTPPPVEAPPQEQAIEAQQEDTSQNAEEADEVALIIPVPPTPEPAEPEPEVEIETKVSLSITSSPSGADVTMDGENLGETPINANIPMQEDDATLEIRYRGYRTYRQTISLNEPELSITAQLNRREAEIPQPEAEEDEEDEPEDNEESTSPFGRMRNR